MRTDFSPFFRSSVGFDRLFSMLDQAPQAAEWPPYNIEKAADDAYRITLAIAGFGQDEVELTQNNNTLIVQGQKKTAEGERQFLHRGIAARQFRQTFNLADHVRVTGAALENGLLIIDLLRELPETMKPRQIAIGGASTAPGQDNTSARVADKAKAA